LWIAIFEQSFKIRQETSSAMASGIAAHLRDLEQEARDAERDLEDYRDICQRRTEAWNAEINDLIIRVQQDKLALKAQMEKKQLYSKKKNEEVQAFRVSFVNLAVSIFSLPFPNIYF
jgi:hypothetical protein